MHTMKTRTEYHVIWHTPNVTEEQMRNDLPKIKKQCKIAEKHEPFFPIFGGTVTLGDRTYQVSPYKVEEIQ